MKPDLVMDLKKMGFRDGSALEINIGNILEHLETKDIHPALNECRRLLDDKGLLFITIPLIDLAEKSLMNGEIDENKFESIVRGEGDGYNSHKTEFRMGDIEKILHECSFESEPLNLSFFPYLVVANVNDPKPDSWQYGVKAWKA